MKKALIISNKIRKIPGGSVESVIEPLKKRGYEVTWAANFDEAKFDLSEFPCNILKTKSQTSPFALDNRKTRHIILNYLKDNNVDLIFCSTPIGGLHGRVCGKKAKVRKVFYQAHGFLFFKGGPKLGFLYKMLEKHLAKKTDVLITINHEDFENAKKFKLKHNGNVYMVNGSGENYTSISMTNEEKESLRLSLKINKEDFVFVSIGELNKNKNVISSVKAFKKAYSNNKNLKMLICGEGKQSKPIIKYITKNNLENAVFLLGYRNDVKKLLQISNCYISSSLREGLSRTVGESMAAGLPCIVSNKRGLSDWMDDQSGYMFNPKKINEICDAMNKISNRKDFDSISKHNRSIVEKYSTSIVSEQMNKIFDKEL